MRIKGVKGQPLLQPPKPELWAWARMTAEDEGKIRAMLASKREEPHPSVAEMLYEMKELGIPARVGRTDVENMMGELDQYRGRSKFADVTGWGKEEAETFMDGGGIARTHYYMRRLGVGKPVTERDEMLIRKALKKCRGDRTGIRVAELLVHMRGLGLDEEVTGSDRRMMSSLLQMLREDRYGKRISWLHYNMKALGIGEPVTAEDLSKMREDLRELRGEIRTHLTGTLLNPDFDLPKALMWAASLLPADGGREKPELPPLRRFRG